MPDKPTSKSINHSKGSNELFIELMNNIVEKPGIYLTTTTTSELRTFIRGYICGLLKLGIEPPSVQTEFKQFLLDKINLPMTRMGPGTLWTQAYYGHRHVDCQSGNAGETLDQYFSHWKEFLATRKTQAMRTTQATRATQATSD